MPSSRKEEHTAGWAVGEASGDTPAMGTRDTRQSPSVVYNPFYTGRPRTPINGRSHAPLDRLELIRRIKSRESKPNSPELERAGGEEDRERQSPSAGDPHGSELDYEAIGMEIERPRSALHKGDFRDKDEVGLAFRRFGQPANNVTGPPTSTSPAAPWHSSFPAALVRQTKLQRGDVAHAETELSKATLRSRATTQATLASSFTYKPPTSPLVQSSRADTPEPAIRRTSRSPDKSRRHTYSPLTLKHTNNALEYPASARGPSSQEFTGVSRRSPYQAHQPRRSLHSFQSLPQTPVPRSRRPSLAEAGLHHAPMVGSYEESILRGRMSTTPSKPLNFVAEIGVLGKGDCPAKLKCPPHVSVPFPAVFYSYASASKMTDQLSPYVGMVDIESTLPTVDMSPEKRRQKLHCVLNEENSRSSSRTRDDGSASDFKVRQRQRAKAKRRNGLPKAPPGGSYRIPQEGQLQIIIKNPNKTAVKLFLIPYDLSDMEAGQKTFIRQRSYSAGPIIDMPLTSRKNFGTDRPEAALSTSDDPNDRPTLRYLIHIHICCPSKGRYFLYKSVRVVFANRVPDGKEKLRNETQLPEPRYSAYKPAKDGRISGAVAPAMDAIVHEPQQLPETWLHPSYSAAQSLPTIDYLPSFGSPTQSLPYDIEQLSPLDSRPASRAQMNSMDVDSQWSGATVSPRSRLGQTERFDGIVRVTLAIFQPRQQHEFATAPQSLDVLTVEGTPTLPHLPVSPFTFERNRSRERHPGVGSESLLSRRLKDLAFQEQPQGSDGDGL
ncbi:hypothetical protein LTR62_004353 [Meristemomyces frigidus]|uniref:Atos-like conserved domain-containing protein n=1 Tax=Meristemomyces frigidus TaxID=1508187 RepID=A0AAN7TFN4_9PEZI|nr:hypothetical protein LTR62_004353 [Meristemomyces frigidus]